MTQLATIGRRAAAIWIVLGVACAPPSRPKLPSGPGLPVDNVGPAFDEAASACQAVRTWTAEIALSGRSGERRLRGRLIAGLAPASLYLEAVAPFGRPLFQLAARDGDATLLLPRERRVLNAQPAEIVEALIGVWLGPDDLRALLAGCVAAGASVTAGRTYPDGSLVVDLDSGATALLKRRHGRWWIEAGRLSGLTVWYGEVHNDFPHELNLRSEPGHTPDVDLTLEVSQLGVNVRVPDTTFALTVRDDVVPITLEELRADGPLGDQ